MSEIPKSHPRPISPHLQVYRLPMTAVMSISHRITGAILTGGMVLVAAFLIAAAFGEDYYNMAMEYATTPLGTAFLFAWSFVLFYHTCNGVRHLIWDTGAMFEKGQTALSGWIVLLATAALTAGTWYLAAAY